MSVPLSIILLPLALFALIFVVFSLINIAHMIRFAAFDMVGFFATFIFLAGSTLFMWYAWQLLSPIDWTMPLNFSLNIFTQMPQ